jgi:hypothetical protein
MRGAFWIRDTTRQLNTHNIESRDVHYPWHPWYGSRVWVYRISLGRVQPTARCGLEPTQCVKSLVVPVSVRPIQVSFGKRPGVLA